MKTIIAGTRTITNAAELEIAIAECGFQITEVVCGGAKGVDELGRLWAVAHNVPFKIFTADWATYGPVAGPMRNTQMVQYAEVAIFLWDGVSRGTADCIRSAGLKGLPMHIRRVL